MSEKIRWGILSTARIKRSLMGPMQEAKRSELVAIASRDLVKAQACAAEHNIPKAYGSYEDLLADPEIDVIYNPLPNSLHCEWTVKAAEAGKHVLCEKPLVTSFAELDQIEAAALDNDVTVFEAFMYLHHPQTFRIQDIIQSGRLGEIQLITSWFNFYLPPDSGNIRLKPELGGGSLWDVGVYPTSMAIVMGQAGLPTEVWANQIKGKSGVDISLAGQMNFDNGVTAQISCGFRAPFRQGTHIIGEEGILQIAVPWKPCFNGQDSKIELYTGDDTPEETIIIPAIQNNPYLCEVEAMEACVLDGAEPIVPLSLSRAFLHTVLALYESAETGQIVKL